MPFRNQHTVVLGGGICGLAAAYELMIAGQRVTLIEGSNQLGGLGTYFDWNGNFLDKFYHCQMPSDADLLKLIDDVGVGGRLYWRNTRMGFVVGGKRYAFNSALDLLKFKPLGLFERLRFGVVSLLLRHNGKGKDLDNLSIERWFSGLYGDRIWRKLLKPLFVSKFGPAASGMPALYIWERLGREKNKASRGYMDGGLKGLIDAIEQKLTAGSVVIHKGSVVASLSRENAGVTVKLDNNNAVSADWCISTLPLPTLRRATENTNLKNALTIPELDYQGVVNAMFFLNRPLDNFYWSPVVDSSTEFDGLVEMTELVKTEHYADHTVVYAMKYCDRDSELFKEPKNKIIERWTNQLIRLYPDLPLTRDHIVDARIFRAPFVEPIYPLGYSNKKPEINDGESPVFLATSAQVYPRITAWNSSVGLAKEVVTRLLNRIN